MRGKNVDQAVDRVAEKVKRWRMESGLSLQEVANRSGVSPSTIHKIEHRHTVPTIAVVLKLVDGLGKNAADLFDEIRREHSATHVRRSEQAEVKGNSGARLKTLAGEKDFGSMGIWRVVQPPGTEIACEPPRPDDGEIIIYLEEGQLKVEIDDLNYTLEAGDSLHFESPYSYRWQNNSALPAVALVMSSTCDSIQPMLSAQMGLPAPLPPQPSRENSVSRPDLGHTSPPGY